MNDLPTPLEIPANRWASDNAPEQQDVIRRLLDLEARQYRPSQFSIEGSATTIINNSALENKIVLWRASKGDVETFDPTDAGLLSALSAAQEGDTLVLPSAQIDLLASIAIKIGVSLIGLSRSGSVLSFTGLSNTSAIELASRAALEHLTVTVAGTQPLVGVDARAPNCAVRSVTVNMASHANNVCIYAGYPESAP